MANGPIQLGTYHMVDNNQYEPQRTNNFEVQITGLDNLTTSGGSSMGTSSRLSEAITLAVGTYGAPQINVSPIIVSYGNNKIKFAGTPEFPESSISLNDYIGVNIERILMAWQRLVYDPKTQKVGKATAYKKLAYLHEFSPDGEIDRQWELHGCWPSSINLGEFNQEGGSVRQISMTMQYDYAVPVD